MSRTGPVSPAAGFGGYGPPCPERIPRQTPNRSRAVFRGHGGVARAAAFLVELGWSSQLVELGWSAQLVELEWSSQRNVDGETSATSRPRLLASLGPLWVRVDRSPDT